MDQEQKKEILAFAKQQFTFLKTEKGFIRPLINRPDNGLLIYRNATLGIRVAMDIDLGSYDYMEITIGKLEDKRKFPVTNEGPERSLWLLQSLLDRQLHAQDKRILELDQLHLDMRKTQKEWDSEQWKYVINLYQSLLFACIDLILQQPDEVLFPTAIEYRSMWSTHTEWEHLAHTQFAFLQEYGFQPEPIFVQRGWFTTYTWVSPDRGVQLIVETRDINVYCNIVRLIDSKLPTMDESILKKCADFRYGLVAGVPLCNLLSKQFKITDAGIDAIDTIAHTLNVRHWSDCDYRYISAFITQYADLVKRFITPIMQITQRTLFPSIR